MVPIQVEGKVATHTLALLDQLVVFARRDDEGRVNPLAPGVFFGARSSVNCMLSHATSEYSSMYVLRRSARQSSSRTESS